MSIIMMRLAAEVIRGFLAAGTTISLFLRPEGLELIPGI